jgi:glycine cleavage system H protein|tara:strand:- start:2329 stop:2706 length:378 start_codon:yes stop_codon:yes gene_type:complete
MDYLEELFYTNEHVWLKYIDNNKYRLGITYFAQDLLGDIVFIDINASEEIFANRPMGIIESVKTASDIIAPVDGKILNINQDLTKAPELLNDKPHETWICEILINDIFNKNDFLRKAEYLEIINS